jgi:hypothetical protein
MKIEEPQAQKVVADNNFAPNPQNFSKASSDIPKREVFQGFHDDKSK